MLGIGHPLHGFVIAGRVPAQNDGSEKSVREKIKLYLKSDEAPTLMKFPGQLIDCASEGLRATGRLGSAESLQKVSEGFGSTTKGLFYASWFVGSIELTEQVQKVASEGVHDGRMVELVRKSFKWVSTSSDSVVPYFLPAHVSTLKDIKTVTDLVAESIGAYQAADSWATADHELTRGVASPEVQCHFKAERKLHMLSLIKAVMSAVALVFGVIGLYLGVAVVPAIVLLSIGVAASALSVIKHFYKANMAYKPLSDWKFSAAAA